MKYYSINNKSVLVDFKQATIEGQAADKGLYFPTEIPKWEKSFLKELKTLNKVHIGFEIMKPYVGESIPEDQLWKIMEETLSFDFPLKQINQNISVLELFHGPTLAFKDLGARFLSRCLGYFANSIGRKITVLVATSGDTGGAVADAFYNVEGTEVIILYPSGKVSIVQEKQLTTMGANIHALEVEGDFDDCQLLVKTAFADPELKEKLFLTSANSINISRWLSQQIYYAIGQSQWTHEESPIVSVPSGNFGNICAGLLAQKSGLEIKHFIAACNLNDVFTRYLATGNYEPSSSHATVSNAMDVGNPSNFVRITELYNHNIDEIKKHVSSNSFSDDATEKTIKNVFEKHRYLLDPHSAVAYLGMEKHIDQFPKDKGIILGTAHPVKFPSVVERVTQQEIPIPVQVEKVIKKDKNAMRVAPNFAQIKSLILQILQ